jgi:DNA-binding CsgD family transcriptional regulator
MLALAEVLDLNLLNVFLTILRIRKNPRNMLTWFEKLILVCFMITGGFLNEEQREELEQITRRSIEPHGVARRANAVLLLDDGKSCALIAEFLYLDDDTIRTTMTRSAHGINVICPVVLMRLSVLTGRAARPI